MEVKELIAVATHDRLTAEEELALATRIQDGDKEAINELIEKNMQLVIHVAKRYTSRRISMEEFISVGAEALYEAALRYDPKRKIRFSTFAMHWIRRKFADLYWESSSTIIRVPRHISWSMRDSMKPGKKLSKSTQETFRKACIARQSYADIYEIDERRLADRTGGTDHLRRRDTTSSPSHAFIKATDQLSLYPREWDQDVQESEWAKILPQAMTRLVEQDRDVLAAYFGFPPYEKPLTLLEYGKIIGRTKEAVRLRKKGALERLQAIMEEIKEEEAA